MKTYNSGISLSAIERAISKLSTDGIKNTSLKSIDEFNVSVNYCGRVISQTISSERIAQAYKSAVDSISYGKGL